VARSIVVNLNHLELLIINDQRRIIVWRISTTLGQKVRQVGPEPG
jgi:hypothetical protein